MMPTLTRSLQQLLLLCSLTICLSLTGCGTVIGHLMVDAPNRGQTAVDLGESCPGILDVWGVDRQFRIDVGPPAASLLTWVIDPVDEVGAKVAQPKGTILVLHGYRDEMEWFTCKARSLSRHGYRTVLVDLRGQGSSTGDFMTFGVQESKDMVRVIDTLTERGEIVGPIGVWGMSYGASTAIMTGAADPRVKAVVSVAPFESMRSIVPHMVRLLVPGYGWCATDHEIDEMISERGRTAGFNPDDANMADAAARSNAPLLLLHGAWDCIVPAVQSEHIAESAKQAGKEVRRVVLPVTGHISIYFDAADTVETESAAWFDRWLAPDAR